jgi:hypothetical protein
LWRQPIIAAYVAGLVPALLMALMQPVWSRVDEAQHTDFIVQLSHGVYPLADRTLIDQETLRLTQSTGVYRFEAPGSYPTPDASDIGPPPPGMSPRNNSVWMSRHLWQLSYESAQPPGYYVLMVPFWRVADRIGGTVVAVFVMRIINALLVALLAPMALAVAVRISPSRREVAVLAVLLAAVLPGLALNATRVSNDALAAVLGGLLTVIAVRSVGSEWTWRRAVGAGLALGIGLLVKLTLIGLLPALGIAMLWPARGSTWPERIVRFAIAATVAAACLVPWLLINEHNYGAPSPLGLTGRLTQTLPMPFSPGLVALDAVFFVVTYWAGEPLGGLPLAAPFVVLGCLVALIGTIGLIIGARQPSVSRGPLLVAIAAAGAMVSLALVLPSASGFDYLGPGRYAYPALPATAALIAIGLGAALRKAFARRALTGFYAVAAVAVTLGGALGLEAEPSPAAPGSPPPTAAFVTTDFSGHIGSFSIEVDGIALDSGNRASWLHVTATNRETTEVEWSPSPIVEAHGGTVIGDYARSTHLPGDLDPGETVSGWIYVPLVAEPGSVLQVRFPNVALDGYHTVGDVTIQLSV